MSNTIYHLAVESPDGDATKSDLVARRKLEALRTRLDEGEGTLALSRGFGMTPAMLILTLETKTIEDVFPDEQGWKLVPQERGDGVDMGMNTMNNS